MKDSIHVRGTWCTNRLPDTKILSFRRQTIFQKGPEKLSHLAGWSRFPSLLSNKLMAEWGRAADRTLSHTFPRAGTLIGSFAQCQFLCTSDSTGLSWDSCNPPQTSCAVTVQERTPTHNLYPAEWANKQQTTNQSYSAKFTA